MNRRLTFLVAAFEALVVAVAKTVAVVVSGQTRRTSGLAFEHGEARIERAIEFAGLGTKKRDAIDGREAGEMPWPTVVGDEQLRAMKQQQQLTQAFGVAGEVDAGVAAHFRLQFTG